MTQQNASLVEETASAGEEMANQAQELLALVEQFKISDDSTTSNPRRMSNYTSPTPPSTQKTKSFQNIKPETSNSESNTSLSSLMKDDGFEEF